MLHQTPPNIKVDVQRENSTAGLQAEETENMSSPYPMNHRFEANEHQYTLKPFEISSFPCQEISTANHQT